MKRLIPNRETQIDIAALILLGAATFGFFWRLLLTQDIWMPAGGGDLAGFLYPTYHFAAEWWRRGVLPLWNPYLFGGQPFIGDIQSGILYPFNILTYLIANPLTYRDLELLVTLHFYIAGVGMYSLLRWGRLGNPLAGAGDPLPALSRWACLAGAVAFEFSDLFITHFGNLNLIASAAWLPFVFLFFSRALDQGDDSQLTVPKFTIHNSQFIIAGVFLALSFLAGHIQSFVFVALAIGLYALFRAGVSLSKSKRISFPVLRPLILLGLTLLVGLGLSAAVLLPAVEMTGASVRSSYSYENAAQYSLPPTELVGLLVPGFFGRGPQAAWGPWDRVEVGYLGILPLILASLALLWRRDARAWFFG
ncbi:MAG: hypothetical protein WCF84_19785, partial [Anaerolineae bacterium]